MTDWVHHNLQTGRVSVRHGGQVGGARRVTLEADAVLIANATPHVSAAGWKRSRTAGAGGGAKRSVHADIRGEARETLAKFSKATSRRISYNPNRSIDGNTPTFHYSDTGEEWMGSALVVVTGGYAYETQPSLLGLGE
jgi:hypothetical protein